MKTFMEEYGLIVVAAIIIMIFVLVATPIGTSLKDGVRTTVDKFTSSMVADEDEGEGEGAGSGLTYTSLGNYQHKASDGTVESHDTESGTCSKCGETVLAAGLYDAEGNMTMSWEALLDGEYIFVTDGVLEADTYSAGNGNETACDVLVGKLVISDFVTSIGSMAFENCYYLTSITIPDSVTSIQSNAFISTGLTSITIPDSVTSIEDSVFDGCTDLTSITIPDSVTSIQTNTFMGCSSLISVDIPNSVTSIGEIAFSCCDNLKSINYSGTKAEWNSISLEDAWNEFCPEITVHCTDGDIVVPAYN